MNPVLSKDMLQTLREKRVAVIQMLFAVVLGIGVLACWPQEGVLSVSIRAHDNLFDTLMLSQLVFLVLFVPGAASVSLVSEHEKQTFELLQASRLTSRQIVTGKIGGAIVFPVLLLLTSLPYVGLLVLRGASSLQSLMIVYATLLLTAIYLAMLAMAVAAHFRKTSSALIFVYLVVAGVCVAPLIPASILLANSSGAVAFALHYTRALSPLAAVLAILRPEWGDFDGRVHSFASLWPVYVVAAAAVTGVSALVLAGRLSRKSWENEEARANLPAERPLWHRVLFYRRAEGPRPLIATANPLLINETRINSGRSAEWCVRLFYVSVLGSMGIALISMYGGGGDRFLLNHATQIVIAFQMGMIALITPVLTSTVVSSEREKDTFELLRMTPLRPGEIFFGKLAPALIPSLLPLVAFLPAYGTICFLDPGYLPYFIKLVPILALATIFCCTAGLVCSVFAKDTSRATVFGYVLTAAVFLGPILLAWAASRVFSPVITSWIAMPSPLFVGLNLVDLDPAGTPPALLWSANLIVLALLVFGFFVAAKIRLASLLGEG